MRLEAAMRDHGKTVDTFADNFGISECLGRIAYGLGGDPPEKARVNFASVC
jgi:hypothetical protein